MIHLVLQYNKRGSIATDGRTHTATEAFLLLRTSLIPELFPAQYKILLLRARHKLMGAFDPLRHALQ